MKKALIILHYGDLTDTSNIIRILQEVQLDEIYNLGAQSYVAHAPAGYPRRLCYGDRYHHR
ncbi:hypothetical protein AGMMS49546_36940 [Spirochaetia bacterium]|nr:hypothetical protein AGMMS49546_36940 [Spirochaetia bacterium]